MFSSSKVANKTQEKVTCFRNKQQNEEEEEEEENKIKSPS